jgi:hypothetical protein
MACYPTRLLMVMTMKNTITVGAFRFGFRWRAFRVNLGLITAAGLAKRQSSGADVSAGAGLLGQPVRIGSGFIRARFHAIGQGLVEYERGAGLEFAAEQAGGAGCLESQGPPVLATGADLGEFHLAPWLLAQPLGGCRDLSAGS